MKKEEMVPHERVEKILKDMTKILEEVNDTTAEKLKLFVAMEPKLNQIYATLELFSDQNYSLAYNRFYVKEENGKKILDTEYATNEHADKSFIPELDVYAAKVFDGVDY